MASTNGVGPLTQADQVERFTVAASALLDRMQFASRVGLSYGGLRDIYAALGWPRNLTWDDYYNRYERQSLAGRVVDMPADATWREGFELEDDDDPDVETPFETAWRQLDKRLKLGAALAKVDRLAGIGRYAVLFLGVRGQDPTMPLRRARDRDLVYVSIFSEPHAQVDKLVDDPADERFGSPETYSLQVQDVTSLSAGRVARVHWTRVLHVAEALEESKVFGRPRLQRVFNELMALELVVGATGEAFWRGAKPRLHANVEPEFAGSLSASDLQTLGDEIAKLVHNFQDFIRTSGTTVNQLPASIADPSGPANVLTDMIAAATGIPKRILLGSERGELASGQDAQEWAHRVDERQRHFAEPMMVRPLVDLFVDVGILPPPREDEYRVVWPDITGPTAEQRAELASLVARAEAQHGQAKLVGGQLVTDNEMRELLGYQPAPELDKPIVDEPPQPPEPETPQEEAAPEEETPEEGGAGGGGGQPKAQAWDESKHPRDPGGEGGGQWIEKGTTGIDGGPTDEQRRAIYGDPMGKYRDYPATFDERKAEAETLIGWLKNAAKENDPKLERWWDTPRGDRDNISDFYRARGLLRLLDEGELPQGTYWRGTNRREELADVMAGKEITSTNWATGAKEAGLSVESRIERAYWGGYKYAYQVKGDIIGVGSDGEPVITNLRPVGKLLGKSGIASAWGKQKAKIDEILRGISTRTGVPTARLWELRGVIGPEQRYMSAGEQRQPKAQAWDESKHPRRSDDDEPAGARPFGDGDLAAHASFARVVAAVNAASDAIFREHTADRIQAALFDLGNRVVARFGREDQEFDLATQAAVDFMRRYGAERVQGIGEETRKLLRQTLTEGLRAGESDAQLARRVRVYFRQASKGRARVIAATEAHNALNHGMFVGMAQAGVVAKIWRSMRDDAVRDTHRELEGQVRHLGDPFEVPSTGAKAMRPGGFGIAGEDIGCRCVAEPASQSPNMFAAHAGDPEWPRRLAVHERRVLAGVRRAFAEQQAAVITALRGPAPTVAAWDESKHPRDPGGEGGGQWIEKGSAGGGGADELRAAVPAEMRHLIEKHGLPTVSENPGPSTAHANAYYDATTGTIYNMRVYGDPVERRDALVHEWGHHIDYAMGEKMHGEGGRITPWSEGHAYDIRQDQKAAEKAVPAMKKIFYEGYVAHGKVQDKKFHQFADFMGALTKNKVGYGHTNRQYNKVGYVRGKEMFAEAVAMRAMSPDLERHARRAAPQFYALFDEAIKK